MTRPPGHLDLQTVLDAFLDAVLIANAQGRIEAVNGEACRLLECSSETLCGALLEDALGPEHRLSRLARRARQAGRGFVEDEVVLQRRSGDDLRVDLAAAPMGELAGSAGGGVLITLRDHSVGDPLREWVSERDTLARYGHIAAGIAHEVKNPLGGIRGAAELLASWAREDRERDAAGMIIREVDRIRSLVDELMVFARGDVLHEAPLNLHQILDHVLEVVGLEPLANDRRVERSYDPSIPRLLGDADRLTQVFLNLTRNALQAMEDSGGILTVGTRITLENRLVGPDGRPVATLEVAISDTGVGIPPEILDRLATPFFTTRAAGTGLGLAVSRHWVARHGGSLRVSSVAGEGTTVRVTLPLRLEKNSGSQP